MTGPHPVPTPQLQLLEEVALGILREMKLSPEDREALEKAVCVARALRKLPTHPEGKP